MAIAIKNKNMDIKLISEITGLSIGEIRKLRPDEKNYNTELYLISRYYKQLS